MESKHFYKVKASYDLYDSFNGGYFPETEICLQTADTEEDAIRFVISHIKFAYCAWDAASPNGEAVKNFKCSIEETVY